MSSPDPKPLPFLFTENQYADLAETTNRLYMSNILIPEEIVLHILSYVEPKELLKYSLVCHKWNKLIKSLGLWSKIYKRKYNRNCKDLPWFLYYCLLSTSYFDTNVLLNEERQDAFVYWRLTSNTRENLVVVTKPLVEPKFGPQDHDMFTLKIKTFLKDLRRFSCCSASPNFFEEEWLLKLTRNKLFHYILDSYRPHIYIRNCGYIRELRCESLEQEISEASISNPYLTEVKDVEVGIVMEYPKGIRAVMFEQRRNAFIRCRSLNEGVVKFLFDSIEPLCRDEYGNICPKKSCSHLVYEKLPPDLLCIDDDFD